MHQYTRENQEYSHITFMMTVAFSEPKLHTRIKSSIFFVKSVKLISEMYDKSVSLVPVNPFGSR